MPSLEGRPPSGPNGPNGPHRIEGIEAPPEQGSAPGSAVNRERLAVLAGVAGGSGLVAELAGLFVDDVPPRLDLIRSAIGSEDAEALVRPAHSLKGSASTLGADRMADLCKQMEAIGEAKDWPQAEAKLASIEAEFERVKQALAEWITPS